MAVFGLTGNLASGKSLVLKRLRLKGAVVFDTDKRIHEYYKDKRSFIYKKVAVSFPESVSRGVISHKKLSKIVFSDKNNLIKLEKIVHPIIIEDLLKWTNRAKKKKGIYVAEVPLLFEKKLQRYFDGVILVFAKRSVMIKRAVNKYNFSRNEALRRIAFYKPIREKIKGSDFIVNNNLDFKKIKKEVDLLWRKIS